MQFEKKHILLILFVSLSFLFLLFSCKQNDFDTKIAVRTIIESTSSTTDASIRVFAEGKDGNLLTGALVVVKNSKNNALVLSFDPDTFCYTGSMPAPEDGEFYFSVKSALSSERKEYSIRHQKLTTSADLQEMKDAEGNSALSGQKLQVTNPVQIVWNAVVPNAVYQVQVSDSFDVLYAVSTKETQCIIPADTFTAGNYFVSIITQSIFGDPLFISSSYYSVSSAKSASWGVTFE